MSVTTGTDKVPAVKDADMRLEVGSHYVRVTGFNAHGRYILMEYCRGLAQYGLERLPGGRFRRVMLRVFVGVNKERTYFHFHRHQLDDLISHLGSHGIPKDRLYVEYLERPTPGTVEFEVIDERQPRDYQVEFIDYICNDQHSNIVTLDPGRGKTFIFLTAMARLKKRTMFVIKPMYIEKWIGDLNESIKLKPGELMVVRGGKDMKAFTQLAALGAVDSKVIIVSNMTYFNYLKDYERFDTDFEGLGYGCVPHELCTKADIGIKIIDEIHQDWHLNYRQDLYNHVWKSVGLSGSLLNDDPFINKTYDIVFPNNLRINNGERDVYVAVVALEYHLKTHKGINYKNHSRKSYSHVMYEKSLMKRSDRLTNYFRMITDIVYKCFVKVREEGQKMIVFAATVDMCTALTKWLQTHNPTLNVQRYVSDDDYEEMLEADLIISTVKSLGTAIDVPDLVACLLTDALNSQQANIQCLGRLRRLKRWPDTTPVFYYLVNVDINKHVEYHHRKMEIFKGRVIGHKTMTTDYRI
jgi:superfamily II DNA or RNA helicase